MDISTSFSGNTDGIQAKKISALRTVGDSSILTAALQCCALEVENIEA